MLLLVPLFVASTFAAALVERACTVTPMNPYPNGYVCNEQGSVSSGQFVSTTAQSIQDCANTCINVYNPDCVAFSVQQGQGAVKCGLYNKKLIQSNFKKGSTGVTFFNRHCYNRSCDCPANQNLCKNRCVNFNNDSQNCGSCGVKCTGKAECNKGKCS